VAANPVRHYPHGKLFSHVLGYVNRLNAEDLDGMTLTEQGDYAGTHYYGRSGVERYYENRLHGQVGYRQVETNARGRILRVLEQKPPVPGENLRLTLDMDVQRAADEALGDTIIKRCTPASRAARPTAVIRSRSTARNASLEPACFRVVPSAQNTSST
jgi:penicillin-binding protein 2